MFYEVIPSKIFGSGSGASTGVLTYASDLSLQPGHIVAIPLGRATALGVILKKVAQPNFPTKKITRLLYSTPLPRHLLATARFIADYYQVPLPSALTLILPAGLVTPGRLKAFTPVRPDLAVAKADNLTPGQLKNRTNQPKPEQTSQKPNKSKATEATKTPKTTAKTEQTPSTPPKSLKIPLIPLNTAQKNALQALQQAPSATKLLFGLTGSGKTHIYLSEALRALQRQKSTVLLVPEIALTSQLVRVFQATFGDRIVLIHSRQKTTERRQIFTNLLTASEPKIIIGPRSALFAPLHDLGLIIIDEEHEPAYFQENAPRYSAIRVASFIANYLKISCILGSATPNIADYHLAKTHSSLVTLSEKALKTAEKPEIHLIDLKNRDNFSKNRYFSNALLAAITENLDRGLQTLIFHNRRGSAPLTICEECGEELLCPNCFLPLTLHADRYELVCHTCDFHEPLPASCPKCGAVGLVHKGFGTKLLESELKKRFPAAKIRRFDADNRPGETLSASYEKIHAGQVDILVGTQTLAKGLDLPKLATVGVVQADAGLSLPDFAAEERTFQLLTQVIGRVGRGHQAKSEVFIQTFRPEHPLFRYAIDERFPDFADYILQKRRSASFPPFYFVAQCTITLKTESLVVKKIRALTAQLSADPKLLVSPPMPAFHEHTSRGYTWQLVVRARSRAHLLAALTHLDPNVRVTFDPPSLL